MGSEIKNQGASVGTSGSPKSQKTTKRVEDIILDKNHPAYTGPDSMGVIFFADEKTKEDTLDPTTLPRAKPLNLNFATTPSIGDLVHIESSVSDDYYPEMGGNSNFTSNYYTNAINVYNNAGSNAVPLNKKTKRKNKKDKTRESEPNFEFEKEFRASTRQAVNTKCDNWLIDHGYPSGRRDRKAPKYTIERASNGDYIRKLDDSKRNKVKLGLYYEENRNQQNLSPSEGSTIFQGKDGQRFHALTTGPNGANAVSRNVTDVDDDGNSNIGDPAVVLSLGRGDTENITHDAASIYLLANQGLPIDVACQLVDSTKSKYEPLLDPLEAIATLPPEPIPQSAPTPELQVQDVFDFDSTEELLTVLETTPISPPIIEEPWDDPVFAALDEAVDEGEIKEFDENVYTFKIYSSTQNPYESAARPEDFEESQAEDDLINEESYGDQLPDDKVPQKVRYKPVFLKPTRKWTLIPKTNFAHTINTFNISDNLKYSVMFIALKEQSKGDNIGGYNHNHYGIMADIGNWSFGSKIMGSISATEGAGGQGIRTDKFRYFAIFDSTKGGIDFMWNTLKGKGFDSATEDNIVDLYIDKWLSPSPATAQKIKNNKRSTYSKIFNTAKDFINNVT